jgi:omega-6 fatty acid desaturase (delta-12 desaturase)
MMEGHSEIDTPSNNHLSRYHAPRLSTSLWQVTTSFLPFFVTWYLMYLSLDVSYGITLALAAPAAGFIMRIFIIQHDCGHGSFFRSRRANDVTGVCCSLFTLTPYHYWRKSHAIHHAGAGKLDGRGIGDIYTMTVEEYLSRPRLGRLWYRAYRNPIVLFLVAPTILFTVLYRFPVSRINALRRLEPGIHLTNLAIGALVTGTILLVGWKSFLAVQAPITIFASSIGMWLFYVQHQFEDTYWSKGDEWDYQDAALLGSSYFRLPRVLQWFSGNIGFHHIHHLSPRIPNYLLEQCHNEEPEARRATVLTMRTSLKSIPLTLWDEERRKLISFSELKKLRARPAGS